MAGEQGKTRTGPTTGLQLRRLPVRPESGQGQTNRGTLADLDRQDQINTVRSGMPGPEIYVPHRATHSNRKTSPLRATTHETHTVALEKQLEGPRITGKGDTGSQVHLRWWLEESNVLLGQPLHPLKHALQIFTDASNEGWGAHLDDHTAREFTESLPESKLHINHLELKAVFLALENPVLVHQTTGDPQGTSHPRPAERDSRQAIQTWPDHSNRVVTSSSSVPGCMLKVAPATSGPVCHQIQQQTATFCVTGARPPGLGSGCTQSLLGGPGPIRLPTGSHLGQSGGEAAGLPLQQNNSDCSRVAQHALVLGPGGNVKPDPTVSALHTKPSVSALQPGPSQEPVEPEPTCLAPRASAIKEQGFSEAVAARIEAPQRRSTRSVYEAKWTIFTKWCLSNQVDFRAPPLKAIADFLLHLFQDKKLQPGTIDGYRSAIADKLSNSAINVSKDENLTRLLDSFHRDRPKGRRGIPSWNLSLVLHQLTKAPFEPLKEASLKYLTFKTVFLLALGSGKCLVT